MTTVLSRRRKPGCLSELDLDELVSGDLAGQLRETFLRNHLQHCATCAQRLDAHGEHPALAPDPLVLRPLRARRRWAMGVAGTIGCAALAGLLFWSPHLWAPTADLQGESVAERSKGTLALTVHVKRATAGAAPLVEQVNGEGQLQAGEEMRFTLASVRPGFAVVLGLDESPSVTVYVPAREASRPTPVAANEPVTLPGGVIADESSGFERIVAIVCPTETSPEDLRRKGEAALARAGGHPEKVSTLGTGCPETSVLFRKTAR